MISLTLSISLRAFASASEGGAVLYCWSIALSVVLKAAVPYAGRAWKSVDSGLYCAKNFFFNSSRNANGIRRPISVDATTRYVIAAWLESCSSGLFDVDDGESAM